MASELPIFQGYVKDGKMTINNRKAFDGFIYRLGQGVVSIEIKKWTRRRSLDQNALIWVCNNIISDSTGYDPIEVHEISKRNCLIPKYVRDPQNKMIEIYSTVLMEKGEVSEYLERMERYWEITLPIDNNLEVK